MRYNTFRALAVTAVVVVVGGVVGYLVLRPPPRTDPDAPPVHVVEALPSTSTASSSRAPSTSSTSTAPVLPPPIPSTQPPIASTVATVAMANAPGLRPIDQDLLAAVGATPVQDKAKDVVKGRGYKINLYSDDGRAWNRAKVDLDRDEKWDEKWTLKNGAWEREVSPADDDTTYSERYVLSASGWAKK